jgi:Hypothetical protein (DUF2513)
MSSRRKTEPEIILDLDPTGWIAMTRDMELVRKIISAIQARKDASPQMGIEVEGYDPAIVMRHVEMLFNAGFIDGTQGGTAGGKPMIVVRDLSWSGHDFASAVENENVWGIIKQKLSPGELATLPLTIVKDAAVAILKSLVMTRLGLSNS